MSAGEPPAKDPEETIREAANVVAEDLGADVDTSVFRFTWLVIARARAHWSRWALMKLCLEMTASLARSMYRCTRKTLFGRRNLDLQLIRR